jgi:hypothetical protein
VLLNACIVLYEKAHKNILLSIEDVTVQRALEREKDELLKQKDVLCCYGIDHRRCENGSTPFIICLFLEEGDHRSSDADLIQHVASPASLLGRFVRMALARM